MKKILLACLGLFGFLHSGSNVIRHQAMILHDIEKKRDIGLNNEEQPIESSNAQRNLSFIEGQTPLHKACMQEDFALVKDLLDAGSDPRAEDANGDTPLMIVIRNRSISLLSLMSAEQKRTKNPWYISQKELEMAFILALYEAARELGHSVGSVDELKACYRSEKNAFLADRRSYIHRIESINLSAQKLREIDQKIYSDPIFSLCLSLLPENRDIQVVKLYAETWADSCYLAVKYFPLGVCIYIGSVVGAAMIAGFARALDSIGT